MCKVSVIIPVYNSKDYIATCVDSIRNQTFREVEIILIEDGSTDGTRAVCENLAAEDARIQLICQQNAGPAAARNRGLRAAHGEWVAFVDADDWLEADCIAKAYRVAAENQADIVLWNMQNEYPTGRIQKDIPLTGEIRIFEKDGMPEIERMMLTEHVERKASFVNMTGPCCKLIRKSITEACFFPENLDSGEDACFIYQVVKNCGKLVYISDVFYHRIILQDSLSNRFDADYWKRRLGYVNWVLEFFKSEETGKKDAINNFCYENYALVVRNYFLRNNKISYRKRRQAVDGYREGMKHEIDYRCVRTEDGVLCFCIRHNLFWCLCLTQMAKNVIKKILHLGSRNLPN